MSSIKKRVIWLFALVCSFQSTLQADARDMSKYHLTLSISCSQKNARVGDPIPVEFRIENVGDTKYDYLDRNYDRGGRMPEYKLVCTLNSGETAKDPRQEFDYSMGGLAVQAHIEKGQHFVKSIDLNRWAILDKPETCKVVGIYTLENSNTTIESKPIEITIKPRTKAEMTAYIRELEGELKKASDSEARNKVLQKLMFTLDEQVIPMFIEAMYEDRRNRDSFWLSEGLSFYFPKAKVKQQVTDAIFKRGLASGMTSVLTRLNSTKLGVVSDPFTQEEWKKVITLSLAIGNEPCWAEGCLSAQNHPDDEYTARLIAIAEEPKSEAKSQAIYALAVNRTDDSVKALKRLLKSPEVGVSETAKHAIQHAYSRAAVLKGRKFLDSDFDKALRSPN